MSMMPCTPAIPGRTVGSPAGSTLFIDRSTMPGTSAKKAAASIASNATPHQIALRIRSPSATGRGAAGTFTRSCPGGAM
ncbi:hypothetical protein ACVOMT_07555 [Sphingomonas panni]